MEFISIGSKCITAMNLKQTGHRHAAYPFDWLFCSLAMVQHCIETNFVYFLDRKHIVRVSEDSSDHLYYQDYLPLGTRNTVAIFNHHNLCDDAQYQTFSRRCARFMQRMYDKSKKVCLVYTIQIDNDTTTRWSMDMDDPEWQAVSGFELFLKDKQADHVTLLTFILQRVHKAALPPKAHIYGSDNHNAFIVYYDQYDNLKDVSDILQMFNQ